ncbi:putative folate/biopterin transporter [Leishmania infantum JPCM5]|uniref:Pteridine_transporter_(Truncated)_-_putative n=2 Tax=Leishmania infantum TaxID=5671 RepID=A0A6L0WJK1_LEIIN|nr:putative folate/biopterin transporter [Leishmania infantum JPCM5]CAC9457075.1 pteridine_transporter_(truncated)_-_putative [Leishmania infantum]CAM66056.1 putative folate/biopterin transporter [Leishmania infantum JPCM5]SUZ39660.1 pteridine_transporter_(truncated)_-_putative [Leishmania infantum]|eukprot:XP_001463689.1 putative folate/biopterin transporter [Leishmania infantum JPCM5]
MSYKEAAPKREKDAAGAAAVPEAAAAGNDGKYIHPEAASLFARCPWVRRVPVFGEAVKGYGLKFIVALGASNLLCKGVADQILYGQTYAMMIDRYGIDVARYQRLSSISTMGWSIKAFTAMLCDGFAFLGYTKRWYMFISCVGGGAFALIYGLLPAKEASANVACAFIFLSSWGKANVDILSQGHYSRLMRQNPKPGPALVSWMWFCIMIGSLIATVMNGPLADAGKPQISIFVSAALQAITCVFYLFNWYGEKKNRVLRSEDALFILEETRKERERLGLEGVNNGTAGAQHGGAAKGKRSPQRSHSDEDVEGAVRDALNDGQRDNGELVQDVYDDAYDDGEEVAEGEVYYGKPPVPCLFGLFEANTEVISKNWKIFVYSVVMTCAVIAMLCANILADTLGLLVACVVVSTICCAASFWALPLVIAKANVFAYLDKAVSIRVSGPLNAFYLNTYGCPGNLPNFTYTFYNTVAGVINTIVGMITVTLFNFLFAKHGYRLTFIVTTIMQVLAALFDIIIVKRWNLYIGIPDHAMYIWGDAVVGEIVYMLGFMPQIVLLSRLCPRGSESVVYALMAGFARLGRTTAASLGAILLEYGLPVFKTQDDGSRCNYDNLPLLLFLCSMCTPLLAIPLSIILLPKARICDDIDIDGKVVRQAVDKQVAAAPLPSSDSDAVMNAEPLHGNKADEREAARGEAVQGKRAGASEK